MRGWRIGGRGGGGWREGGRGVVRRGLKKREESGVSV